MLPILINLHSNMDRLKRPFPLRPAGERGHLHSNMDRLKPVSNAFNAVKEKIYIPIWID